MIAAKGRTHNLIAVLVCLCVILFKIVSSVETDLDSGTSYWRI